VGEGKGEEYHSFIRKIHHGQKIVTPVIGGGRPRKTAQVKRETEDLGQEDMSCFLGLAWGGGGPRLRKVWCRRKRKHWIKKRGNGKKE